MYIKKTKIINVRVAGTSRTNPDGTERQDIIRSLTMGERVHLVRDRENENDLYAVRVQSESGQVIGWVPRHKSPNVGPWLELGGLVVGCVTSRGPARKKGLLSVYIDITLVSDDDREWVEEALKTKGIESFKDIQALRDRHLAKQESKRSAVGNTGCLGVFLLLAAIFTTVAVVRALNAG